MCPSVKEGGRVWDLMSKMFPSVLLAHYEREWLIYINGYWSTTVVSGTRIDNSTLRL